MRNGLRCIFLWSFMTLLSVALVACGGGSGSSPETPPDTTLVTPANAIPAAVAGADQNVTAGSEVTLDGSTCSDEDGDLLSYNWEILLQPEGSSAALSDHTVVNPAFTTDKEGSYLLSLTVNDGTEDSDPAYVIVTAASGNSTPMAAAGADQNVTTGSEISLDGSASSDADADTLGYSWAIVSLPAGSSAALADTTVVNPTFTPDAEGSYVLSLTVNDGSEDSAEVYVTVTAASGNSAPMAAAGADQNITTGSEVSLDGNASSDADADPLVYNWAIVSLPAGSSAALSDPAVVKPTLTPDADGTYVLSLKVNDGAADSAPAYITVTAATGNSAPVADAGPPQRIAIGREVTLDASASSDADGDALSYSWCIVSLPFGSNASLPDSSAANPIFTADKKGSYVLSLVVNDGVADSTPATVTVTTGYDWRYRLLSNISLGYLDLSYISLERSLLVDSNLRNTNLTDANLKGAMIERVNLTGADLTGADLTFVLWLDTICPDGSNSDLNGLTCEGHLTR